MLQITQTVFEKCGTPRLVKRSASTNPNDLKIDELSPRSIRKLIFNNGQDFKFEEGNDQDQSSGHSRIENMKNIRRSAGYHSSQRRFQNRKISRSWDVARPTKQSEKSQFEAVIHDIRQSVRRSQGFWRHLPYSLCASSQETLFSRVLRESRNAEIRHDNLRNTQHGILSTHAKDGSSRDVEKDNKEKLCWNGQDSAPYDTDVIEDGLTNQAHNPEVSLGGMVPPDAVKDQIYKLQTITNQLKQAHRGHDVEWWDNDEDSKYGNVDIMNDGSGDDAEEGSGSVYYPYDDDEDHNNCGSGDSCEPSEGSGSTREDTEDCGWPLNPCKKPEWEEPVAPVVPSTEDPIIISTYPSSNVHDNIPRGSGAGGLTVRRWNKKSPLEMLMIISRFLVPQFAVGLGWYVSHGISGISIYTSRTQTAL